MKPRRLALALLLALVFALGAAVSRAASRSPVWLQGDFSVADTTFEAAAQRFEHEEVAPRMFIPTRFAPCPGPERKGALCVTHFVLVGRLGGEPAESR